MRAASPADGFSCIWLLALGFSKQSMFLANPLTFITLVVIIMIVITNKKQRRVRKLEVVNIITRAITSKNHVALSVFVVVNFQNWLFTVHGKGELLEILIC